MGSGQNSSGAETKNLPPSFGRRRILRGATFAFIGGCSGSASLIGRGFARTRDDAHGVEQAMSDLLQDQEAARAIGVRYREGFPEARDRIALIADIEASLGRGPVNSRKLEQRIRQDFADENTIILDGWVLSRTEARLCALATFL